MSVLKPIDPSDATGTTKDIFDHLTQNMNRIPAMMRVMAHSPEIAETYCTSIRRLRSRPCRTGRSR
jgi:hypothetical protein